MKTTSPVSVAGNTTFNEDHPPLYAAFTLASKRPAKHDSQPAEKEEEPYFEGAD